MRIIKVITKDAIVALGTNTGFNVDKPTNGQPTVITMSKELMCIKINNVLIPMSNVREIVLEEIPVVEEIKEVKKAKAKAE